MLLSKWESFNDGDDKDDDADKGGDDDQNLSEEHIAEVVAIEMKCSRVHWDQRGQSGVPTGAVDHDDDDYDHYDDDDDDYDYHGDGSIVAMMMIV